MQFRKKRTMERTQQILPPTEHRRALKSAKKVQFAKSCKICRICKIRLFASETKIKCFSNLFEWNRLDRSDLLCKEFFSKNIDFSLWGNCTKFIISTIFTCVLKALCRLESERRVFWLTSKEKREKKIEIQVSEFHLRFPWISDPQIIFGFSSCDSSLAAAIW